LGFFFLLVMPLVSVGSAVATQGAAVSGFIDVPAVFDPGTRIPVTVIAGRADGPVLALIAGIHGSEPSPIIALQRIRAEVDPAQLRGSVILVHIANPPSFTQRTIYRGPFDQKNLNRVFPGRSDGTTSDRIAHAITTQVIDQCDFLIDMHSGDGNESLRPYTYWNRLGLDDGVDARAKQLALAFGLDHIVIDAERTRDVNASVFCSNTAHVRGKPSITTEAGGVGVPTESAVALNVQGALGVMRHLEMLPGRRALVERPYWIEPSVVLTSPSTGTWHPAVEADEHVAKGTLIGRLTDYFGETIAEVQAPIDGIVLYIVVSPAMVTGEPIGMIGHATREN
jgi:predicted deacylase